MPYKSEKGNATLAALMVFLIVAILLSGMTIVPSSLLMTAKHEDLVQAQFAAEAGVKRVVATCHALNAGQTVNWDWTTKQQKFLDNADYKTTIVDDLTGEKVSWGTGITDGTYRVTSVGTVDNSRKTVVALVEITNKPPYAGNFPDVTIYSDKSIKSKKSFTINTNGLPVRARGEINNIETSPEIDKKPNEPLILPKFNYDSYLNTTPAPVKFNLPSDQEYYLTEADGKYYYDNALTINSRHNLALYGRSGGSIVFVNGDVNIDAGNNAINVNNPVLIIAVGDVTITSTSCSQVAVFAMKREDGTGGNININSSNLNGTILIGEGDVTLTNVQNCNSNKDLYDKILKFLDTIQKKNPSVISCTIKQWRGN